MMTSHTKQALIYFTVLAGLVTMPSQSLAQVTTDTFDCVIEPHRVVEIGSPVDGILKTVTVDRGDLVQVNQVLATLKSDIETVNLELSRARAEGDVAVESNAGRSEYFAAKLKRAEELFRKGISTLDAVERARTESMLANFDLEKAQFEKDLATVEMERSEVVLSQRTIVAPMAGIVTSHTLSPGAYIYEQTKLLTLAQIDPLNVEVFVPIEMYKDLKPGATALVTPASPFNNEVEAIIEVIDKVFDAASGTFGVRLKLPNHDRSLPAGLKCVVKF